MVRITMIVITIILTKLMTNPSRVRETAGTKTGCILGLRQQSVNEARRNSNRKIPIEFRLSLLLEPYARGRAQVRPT